MNYLTGVTAIIPRLPPAIDGVGDYALNLARQLRQDFNIQTHFVVGNPTWNGGAEIQGFSISQVNDRSPDSLLNLLSTDDSSSILLHYVGYGYAQRGCPVWLVDGLQRWKSSFPTRSLVTMFHEISASGPIWTSSFWLSSLQKSLAARLAQMSDRCITSKQSYGELLYQLNRTQQTEITCLPVFSNIGEPEYLPTLPERSQRLVVFGSRNARLQVYNQCLKALEATCQSLKINEILDIGVPIDLEISKIGEIPIIEKGVDKAEEISKILQDSIAGFLNFPPPTHLAKSTIFASYCAHRLIPCMTISSKVPIDGLEKGKHYLSADNHSNKISLKYGQDIADNAYKWYRTHSLPAQAKIFMENLIS
ncbi:glycosyltransferase family 1 protein [Nostoc sp. UHCC 0251]|uniref:glycosyltransferase family 1 protein n=1 Tax=Nostoc sp. UHCC 0251 TaxID=3110240 RepID=UPI002B1EE1F1|nr:glycosyltransferase family 1 protein [Nostoc sp. UHCC 0251]MEA5626094.1 glycosyltransferase family 1 protein [Nostoc sp. UHCC 0251]